MRTTTELHSIFDRFFLDCHTLPEQHYQIKGQFSPKGWAAVCQQAGLTNYGSCSANLTVHKSKASVMIAGELSALVEQVCGRTLENFTQPLHAQFKERLWLDSYLAPEDEMVLETGQLHVGEFIAQQVLLHLDPFPIHPDSLVTARGEWGISDGLGDGDDEKHPFAVLKGLQKTFDSDNTHAAVCKSTRRPRTDVSKRRLNDGCTQEESDPVPTRTASRA